MRDWIELGSTPPDEPCAQVGEPDHRAKALEECRRFRDLIRKTIGPEPEGATLRIKSFDHDFGTYYELVCEFETDNETAREYAFRCEEEVPATWV